MIATREIWFRKLFQKVIVMTDLSNMEAASRGVPMAAATLEPNSPKPYTIATISAGFEKGDFLVREEQGARIYFDFVSFKFLAFTF